METRKSLLGGGSRQETTECEKNHSGAIPTFLAGAPEWRHLGGMQSRWRNELSTCNRIKKSRGLIYALILLSLVSFYVRGPCVSSVVGKNIAWKSYGFGELFHSRDSSQLILNPSPGFRKKNSSRMLVLS